MKMPGFTAEAVFRPIAQTYRASLKTMPDRQVYVSPAVSERFNICMADCYSRGLGPIQAFDYCKHLWLP
jgi:hypothetical protein